MAYKLIITNRAEEDSHFSHDFSESEINEFVDTLNKVKLGREIPEEKALSTGANVCYEIKKKDGKIISISPGDYFLVNGKYYKFKNKDELWNEIQM